MKTGYALSGGGARGIAHLGIIKALEENKIFPDRIAGTSAGSIIGAFYAQGYMPDEILDIIAEIKLYKIFKPAFNLDGLISLEKSYDFFHKYFPEDSFSSLKIPLTTASVNVRTGKISYFSSGKLISTILASCAIPVVFNPVKIEGDVYIDGGVVNNLPVEPLLGKCDRIIGIHCNPVDPEFTYRKLKNLVERALLLSININVSRSKPLCDMFFEPAELKKFGAFDFAKAREIFRIGYEYAGKEMPKLLKYVNP